MHIGMKKTVPICILKQLILTDLEVVVERVVVVRAQCRRAQFDTFDNRECEPYVPTPSYRLTKANGSLRRKTGHYNRRNIYLEFVDFRSPKKSNRGIPCNHRPVPDAAEQRRTNKQKDCHCVTRTDTSTSLTLFGFPRSELPPQINKACSACRAVD